jgi:MFS family permease
LSDLPTAAAPTSVDPVKPGDGYARYVLAVLVIVYVFNFLDRQILSILNESIKADLGLRDDQLGFLYGTAFAVFYAVFGLPLGRLADVWDRRKLIAWGLAFWSAMTVLSGFTRNFGQLTAARIGVGVGEASASPAAYSMLGDYFPAARRATVLAIYSSGIYLGIGLSLGLGGMIADRWDLAFFENGAPFGLRGWQVAFIAVGTPGLLLALWVSTLREPIRGMADGIYTAPEPHPFRIFFRELRAVVPPFTLLHLWLAKAGPRALAINLGAAAALIGIALLMIRLTGSHAQWIALCLGLYSVFSWAHALALRDPPTFALTFKTGSIWWAGLGFGLIAFVGYALSYWTAPYFIRTHGISASQAGFFLGGTAAAGGFIGVTLGGWISDALKQRSPVGRIWVGLVVALAPLPIGYVVFTTEHLWLALSLNVPLVVIHAMWIGPGASTMQDLVLPRMRGVCAALFLLTATFIGLSLGPYTVGRISVWLDGDLSTAVLIGICAGIPATGFLLLCMCSLPRDQSTMIQRARAAGEPVAV